MKIRKDTIIFLGRYRNIDTNRYYNIYKGKNDKSCTVLFFYRSGKKVPISDKDFYSLKKYALLIPRHLRKLKFKSNNPN